MYCHVNVLLQIKKSALTSCIPFNIHQALDNQLLGQHAGELLLEYQLSVFRDLQAVFGIICLQTTVSIIEKYFIFFCTGIIFLHICTSPTCVKMIYKRENFPI